MLVEVHLYGIVSREDAVRQLFYQIKAYNSIQQKRLSEKAIKQLNQVRSYVQE